MQTRKRVNFRGKGRKGFTWAQEQMAQGGISVSVESLRRYVRLIPEPLTRIGSIWGKGEVRFEPETLEKLASITVLKQLGLTNKEVQEWLRSPQEARLGERVKYVKNVVNRARALCLSAERTSTSPENDGLSASPLQGGAMPSTEGTTRQDAPPQDSTQEAHG